MSTPTALPAHASDCRTRPGTIYPSGLACPRCRAQSARAHKGYRVGALPTHDTAAAVRAVVDAVDAGWTTSAVASATGVPHGTLQRLVWEHRQRGHLTHVTRPVAARLLAPWAQPSTGRVPSVGASRRLRALAAIGWSRVELRARTGLTHDRLDAFLHQQRPTITAVDDAAVRAVYAALSSRRGPDEQATAYAADRAWAPPAAWDDEDLEDPAATPTGVPRARDRRRRYA